mmetsp:Transcript_97015/g.259196  ORF Transcript_97015/g.259196 Transcript_97015/m.259196 type:complete len:362 (+) Transcript_97015:2875-3960(+)
MRHVCACAASVGVEVVRTPMLSSTYTQSTQWGAEWEMPLFAAWWTTNPCNWSSQPSTTFVLPTFQPKALSFEMREESASTWRTDLNDRIRDGLGSLGSLGRQLLLVFPSGAGRQLFRDWRKVVPEATVLSPEAHFTIEHEEEAPYFFPCRDIVIPGFLPQSSVERLQQLAASATRPVLATFHGAHVDTIHVRSVLDLMSQEIGNKTVLDCCRGTEDYYASLAAARFCLVPRGLSSWTNRLYEALHAGCVPVILSDHLHLPFAEVIPYELFTIKWPESLVRSLLTYLESVSDEDWGRMQRTAMQVSCAFHFKNSVCSVGSLAMAMLSANCVSDLRPQVSSMAFWYGNGTRLMASTSVGALSM